MKSALSSVAELSFDELQSILNIKMLKGAVLNLANAKHHGIKIQELTQNKPYLALIDTSHFFTIDEDALKYAAIPSKLENRIAAAYYNPNLANRFTVEIFRKIGNPAFSVQIFNKKEDALQWLKKQGENSPKKFNNPQESIKK